MKIGITERGDAARHFKKWWAKLGDVDGVIAITKDPELLYRKLRKTKALPAKLIVHCTITGFGGTPLEPNVPEWRDALRGHRNFVKWIGPERAVLRIDPIFPTRLGIKKVKDIISEATQSRVRISFLDLYKHVRARFEKLSKKEQAVYLEDLINVYELGQLHAPLWYRRRIWNDLITWLPVTPEVCGEPGFRCTGCVSAFDLDALGLQYDKKATSRQRAACSCLAIKTELLSRRKPCKHGCLYCYWRG